MINKITPLSSIISLTLIIFSCSSQPEKCNSTDIAIEMEKINSSDITLYLDFDSDANLKIVKEDFINYAKRIWGVDNIKTAGGQPQKDTPVAIWLSTGEEARNLLSADLQDGFIIRRLDSDNSEILIYASDNLNLAYGVYAFLEELGVRFFHPVDEFISHFNGIYLPSTLNIERHSPVKVRGIHLHLLHPIEYFRSFNEAGDENFTEAKKFIDWLVKTGQNYLQWSVLSTLNFPSWITHAKKIVEYAHMRGVKVGAEIQLWSGSSLQNSFVLVNSMENWQAQIKSQIDFLMQIPWDNIEIGFGEFLSADPQGMIDMLNYIANYMRDNYPGTTISVVNHVGNYPQLWVKYNNETVFYYHLPKFADPSIINNVHTVFFFDLYRNWGMYNHADFHLQKDYIMELLRSERTVRYKPESAYWCTADIDVPAFLPEYIYSRWVDINGLYKEAKSENLPMIEGHILFSSGQEWVYWLTDNLTAKMLWEPEKDFSYFIEHYAKIYGNCSESFEKSLIDFINLQTTYLFDSKLIPYISGEDFYDDFGYLINIETHPKRTQFEDLLSMSEEEQKSFNSNVLEKLQKMAEKIEPIESSIKEKCYASDDESIKPWCMELYDGVKIIRLRLLHSFYLYKAALSAINGKEYKTQLNEAIKIKEEARKVVEHRESMYRFDLDRYIGSYENPTIYPFGYLKQAHTLCFWERQEIQARYVIKHGTKPPILEIPTCAY